MPNFFAKRDQWGNGLALWVFVGMLFFAPLMAVAIRQLEADNNVQNWLPAEDPQARVLAWYQSHFPAEDRILVTWDGSSLSDPRVERLRTSLVGQLGADGIRRGGSPYVADVMTAREVCAKIVEYGVEPDEVLRRMQGTLIGTGLVKVRLTAGGRAKESQTIAAIESAAAQELGLKIKIVEPIVEFIDETVLADWDADVESSDSPTEEFRS